jgi:hypothetical protein
MPQIVSANRLTDGIIVFLAKGDAWVEKLNDAEIFGDKASVDAGLARAQSAMAKNLIVEITPVEIEIAPGGISAKHIRDRIRSAGPTVHLDHGKQAG